MYINRVSFFTKQTIPFVFIDNNHACALRMIKRSALAWLSKTKTTITRFSFPSHACALEKIHPRDTYPLGY